MIQNDDTKEMLWYVHPQSREMYGTLEPVLNKITGIKAKPYKNLVGEKEEK